MSTPSAPARVLYVQPNSEVGGSDLALLRMVQALDPARFRPAVVLPHDGPLVPALRDAGAVVHFLPMMQLRTLPSVSYQARYLARFWPAVARLARLIRRERIDFVHTNSLYCLYGGFAAAVARVPHVLHVREIPPNLPVARPAFGAMSVGLATLLACMSRPCADGVLGPGGTSPKLRFIGEGLDLDVWSRERVDRDIRAELGIPAGAVVVGFVARLDPWKGLDVFLEAAARVAATLPDAMFLVSGDAPSGFEAYRDRMMARAAELGLGDRVRFLGWRYRLGDIPALMAGLDLFCHTSIEPEPFGLVLIEAMAMGCPVIGAKAGGPLEIVEDGISGVLVPPKDPAALADAIERLLQDGDLRRRIAAGGRAGVERKYSRAGYQRDLAALYADLPLPTRLR